VTLDPRLGRMGESSGDTRQITRMLPASFAALTSLEHGSLCASRVGNIGTLSASARWTTILWLEKRELGYHQRQRAAWRREESR
jgi:hypothetical protein